MKYFPLYTLNNETRYSAYLDFCIRSFCEFKSWTITKEEFKFYLNKNWFDRRTINRIWDRWAYIWEYFRWYSNNKLYISKKWTEIVILVEFEICKKVKSISQFKLFITALQAGKPNDYWNRSRTLKTIWKLTDTCYKQTVSRRIKKAKKLWLVVENRFIKVWDETAQISNNYNFNWVTFLFNRFNPKFYTQVSERIKASKTKKNVIQIEIVNKGKMVKEFFYENYNLLWANLLTI
jgi:hypothetical protein